MVMFRAVDGCAGETRSGARLTSPFLPPVPPFQDPPIMKTLPSLNVAVACSDATRHASSQRAMVGAGP